MCVCVCGRGTGGVCNTGEGRGQVSGRFVPEVTVDTWPRTHDGDHDVHLFNWQKMSVVGENQDTVNDDLCVYFTGKIGLRKNC